MRGKGVDGRQAGYIGGATTYRNAPANNSTPRMSTAVFVLLRFSAYLFLSAPSFLSCLPPVHPLPPHPPSFFLSNCCCSIISITCNSNIPWLIPGSWERLEGCEASYLGGGGYLLIPLILCSIWGCRKGGRQKQICRKTQQNEHRGAHTRRAVVGGRIAVGGRAADISLVTLIPPLLRLRK